MTENKVILMTAAELKEFAADVVRETNKGNAAKEPAAEKRYVYGLRGVMELFNVSHPTAQKYKNTFLSPAVMQRGRKIVVDADYAMELYKSNVE